ncbi:MAG: S1 RNA-binding domain-containing protein [Lachnospiraceae bacterium]|nr:S1 RNA-binding domain-containing protein [Lachnospiraceae bacterium]
MEESMKDYEKELERSFRKMNEGDMVKGTIIAISEEDMTIDLDYYAPGILALKDVTDDPTFLPEEEFSVGDEITATIVKVDDGAGNIVLSMKEATEVLSYDELLTDMENETAIPVKIAEVVNGGVVAYAKGVRGFIPASQLDLTYVEDLDSWLNKKIMVTPITVDKEKEKLVLSAKVLLKRQKEEEISTRISHMVPGSNYEGTVEKIMPYGAFINFGNGLSGLLHISRISQKRLSNPSEVLKEGQQVTVKLLEIKDGKLSLSMKEFEEITEKVEADDVLVEDYNEGEIGTSLKNILGTLKL